jgi:hypothetical protein
MPRLHDVMDHIRGIEYVVAIEQCECTDGDAELPMEAADPKAGKFLLNMDGFAVHSLLLSASGLTRQHPTTPAARVDIF